MPFDPHVALNAIEGRLTEFLADLDALVQIDSDTYSKAGNDAVQAALRTRYLALGAQVDLIPRNECGDILLARLEGAGVGRILLIGHTDTVYPTGTVAERPPRRDGDRFFGPGSADMKAGDLAIVHALRALLEQGSLPVKSIEVLHNTDEEIGSPFSRELIAERAGAADVVLVLEAGRENGDIVSARKGIANFEIEISGRSAHAGVNHARGRSAAVEMAHFVLAVEALSNPETDVTVNVGRVDVPGRPNVVPARASASVEARAARREELETVVQRVAGIGRQPRTADVEIDVRTHIAHYPMERSAGTAQLVRLALAEGRALGLQFSDVATGGASDGNTAFAAGRPVLDGLGPVGGNAHSPDEYVFIPSIAPRTALLAALIARIGADGRQLGLW